MAQLIFGTLPKDATVVAAIMAGGSGTRFWPLSRRARPKQFLSLSPDGEALISSTADRVRKLGAKTGLLVVTAEQQVPLVQRFVPDAVVLAEPRPRNTAPCIAYAALKVLAEVGDVPMLCLPADHLIHNVAALLEIYSRAVEIARNNDVLVTIGIPPTFPETGYGYIRSGAEFGGASTAYRVDAFVEKPNLERAKEYCTSGKYYWNSGMFIWRPSVILAAIQRFLPELSRELELIRVGMVSGSPDSAVQAAYEAISPISIDFGVMERVDNAVLVPGHGFLWSDIGSWSAWVDAMREARKPIDNNIVAGDVELVRCTNTTVVAQDKFVAAVGLNDIVIVESGDSVLVCNRENAQDVKAIVDSLQSRNRDELL